MKNKSYIGISFIILIFGIYAIPKILDKFKKSDLEVLGPVPSFVLKDQNNKSISNANYAGKVYVVEFFFTTCPSICPIMNKNMVSLQNDFLGNPNFGIVSISINPENDTSEVLKEHAQKLGANSPNWHFLTGDKKYIYQIANKGFNLYVGENSKVNGGFEHSGLFALVDKKGNIRCRRDAQGNPIGYYDGLEKKGVQAIKEDITKLLEEE